MIFDQYIKFMQVIAQNSIYFLGDYIFSGMFEPVLTSLMQNYMLPVHLGSAFRGQDASSDFVVDFR